MPFSDLIKQRHSVREFQAKVPERSLLEKLMVAAQCAPSAVNIQPWQFIVVCQEPLLSQVKDCYHREWINDAPVCIVAIGNHREAWHRQADGKDHCDIDVSIAITHLTLQAAELGLASCWVCNFETEKLKTLFNLSAHLEPIALIPIGYPADEKDLSIKEKNRKPLSEIVKWL